MVKRGGCTKLRRWRYAWEHAYTLLCICAVAVLPLACDDGDKPQPVTRRTVMVYIAADNNLSYFASQDIAEMVAGSVDIPKDCRLIVYSDDSENTAIYEIKDNARKLLYSYPYGQCSADPEVLRDAISRMAALAPATSYGLVLWSHGSGWLPGNHIEHAASVPAMQRSVLQETHGRSFCSMHIHELAEVLAKGPHFDYIMFDACLMQSVESDYALRHVTDYIIASPAETSGRGGTYNMIMKALFESPAANLAQAYYNGELDFVENTDGLRGGGIVISTVKTDQLDSLAAVTRKLLDGRELDTQGAQYYWRYSSTGANSRQFSDFVDLKSVMLNYADSPYWDEWQQQLGRTVIACHATRYWDSMCEMFEYWRSDYAYGRHGELVDREAICGMSVFVPDERYDKAGKTWNNDIRETEWWKKVWGSF